MKLTLLKASTELDISRETIRRALTAAGVKNKTAYTLKELFNALADGGREERARLAAAQATKIELENAETVKQLVRLDIVEEKLWTNLLSPLRDGLLTYPKITGAKLKAVLQSRGVADDVAKEAVEVAAAGVREIVDQIQHAEKAK